jgi:hypothetical protein
VIRWLLTLGQPWHMGGAGRHWLFGCPVCKARRDETTKRFFTPITIKCSECGAKIEVKGTITASNPKPLCLWCAVAENAWERS